MIIPKGDAMDKAQILERLKTHLQQLKNTHKAPRNEVSIEWVTQICNLIGIPKDYAPLCEQILSYKPLTRLVWLHMAECTGCSESFLRLDKPGVESLLLEYISLEYHETIMGAVGFNAKQCLHDTLKEEFILVIEGGVSLGENAYFLTSGADSTNGENECLEVARHAQAIFAIGTCSSFGGVQAAYPNPTQSQGISTFLRQLIVNIPGCPPSEANMIGSLMYYILLQEIPPCDSLNRPLWSYGKNLHEMCERKAKFESGDFVESFDDERLQDGYCLYKVGCKGPYVANNCPKVKFNAKTSWPVRAGHGCIACSEPDFWDSFGKIEEPINNANAYIKDKKPLKSLPLVHRLDDTLLDSTLCLELDSLSDTRIYSQEKQNLNLLAVSFYANLSALLPYLASKNKLGARLVENYHKWRLKEELESVLDSESAEDSISHNASDMLKLVGMMFGKSLNHAQVLDLAQSYLFPHISKLDFKLTTKDNGGCEIEVNKSLRLPLCYLLGGLEIEGVAYSVVSSICEILALALVELCKIYNISQVAFKGDLMQNPLIQDRLATYLPKWLKVV